MSISYISGAANEVSSAAGTLSVTYTPTPGNVVVVAFVTYNLVTSAACSDNNGNILISTGTTGIFQFYGIATSGATSYTCTFSGTYPAVIVIAEYSGQSGQLNVYDSAASSTATSDFPSITSTSAYSNSFIVGIIGCQGWGGGSTVTFTQTSGIIRGQTSTSGQTSQNVAVAIIDNLSPTAGSSVTESASFFPVSTWTIQQIEIYSGFALDDSLVVFFNIAKF